VLGTKFLKVCAYEHDEISTIAEFMTNLQATLCIMLGMFFGAAPLS
jgi:hypothetical protein